MLVLCGDGCLVGAGGASVGGTTPAATGSNPDIHLGAKVGGAESVLLDVRN